MGEKFRQLRSEDRVAICHLIRAGISRANIAKQLGFHRSTIYRELKRNNGSRLGYLPITAEARIEKRRKRTLKLENNKSLREYVCKKLRIGRSPEQIAGRLKLENNGRTVICHETIYSYLYSDYGIRNKYYCYLRKKRRFRYPKVARKNKIKIPNRISITERPSDINTRQTIGHWECDLMQFKQGTKTNIITVRERFSRYILAIKNPSRHAKSTADNIIKKLKKFGDEYVKSITFDNGPEFFQHRRIGEALQADTYFCEPYKSYQKGSVENGNKLLREWLPRTTMINEISNFQIASFANQLNQRPMKCLAYLTPKEVFTNNYNK